jgi:hypothetical protein
MNLKMHRFIQIFCFISMFALSYACDSGNESAVEEEPEELVTIKVQLSPSTELVFTPDKIKDFSIAHGTLYIEMVNGEMRNYNGYPFEVKRLPFKK